MKSNISALFLFAILMVGCITTTTEEINRETDTLNAMVNENQVDSLLDAIEEEESTPEEEIPELSGEKVPGIGEVKMFALSLINAQTEVMYETSITIMNEGPHCDLTDWKHGYSEWMDISEVINSDRDTDFPTPEDLTREEFPKVDMKELERAATNHCDEFWGKHSRKCKDPLSYPCGVSASKVWFKVRGTDKKTKQAVEKIFFMETEMGC